VGSTQTSEPDQRHLREPSEATVEAFRQHSIRVTGARFGTLDLAGILLSGLAVQEGATEAEHRARAREILERTSLSFEGDQGAGR